VGHGARREVVGTRRRAVAEGSGRGRAVTGVRDGGRAAGERDERGVLWYNRPRGGGSWDWWELGDKMWYVGDF
jgi:hypothetical protein